MPITSKVYNKLILNPIIPFLEPLLRNNQNGSMQGRLTLRHKIFEIPKLYGIPGKRTNGSQQSLILEFNVKYLNS